MLSVTYCYIAYSYCNNYQIDLQSILGRYQILLLEISHELVSYKSLLA